MKTHANKVEGYAPARSHATPVPNALAHQEQLRQALRRAGVQPQLEIGATNDSLERKAAAQSVLHMPEPESDGPVEAEALSVPSTPVSASATARGNGVIIRYSDGSTETRTGGSPAWRHNNPGNLEYRAFARTHGAIGRAGENGRWAVFPDEATGAAAQKALLLGSGYQNKSIDQAIAKYAPPSENDTAAYQSLVRRLSKLPGNTLMSALTDEQLDVVIAVMRRKEGWIEGTVTRNPAPASNP